jgi:hypothetical protein
MSSNLEKYLLRFYKPSQESLDDNDDYDYHIYFEKFCSSILQTSLNNSLTIKETFDILLKKYKFKEDDYDDVIHHLLTVSVCKNDVKRIKYYIEHCDVDVNIDKGMLLHRAACNGSSEMVDLLLSNPKTHITSFHLSSCTYFRSNHYNENNSLLHKKDSEGYRDVLEDKKDIFLLLLKDKRLKNINNTCLRELLIFQEGHPFLDIIFKEKELFKKKINRFKFMKFAEKEGYTLSPKVLRILSDITTNIYV